MPSKIPGWIALALLTLAGAYGFLHEQLWAERLWSADGSHRFIAYAAVFWIVAGLLLWRYPRRLGLVIITAAAAYTAWWAGPLAPFAVLYFLGSCLCLGRRMIREADAPTATLLGAAVWMLLIWIALHFPINRPGVYAAAFLIPYFFGYRIGDRTAAVKDRKEAAALAVLLFVLIAHLLAALKPEVSADGLSMHLALPMAAARDARWAFDFRLNSWALMPNGADALYAALYRLGGEHAAHLLNFAFLVLLCLLLARAARRWVSPPLAWLIAALFAATPLVQLVTASLFVENVWAAMILAGTLALVRYLEQDDAGDLAQAAVFAGAALAVKVIAGAFVAPMAVIAAAAAFRKRQWKAALAATGLLVLFAAPPYVYAYARTGNPVFPFANARFRSPDFDSTQSFSDLRYTAPLSLTTPFEMTFQSTAFLEAQGGASGFQYFLLVIPAALFARRKSQGITRWTILGIALLASGIILSTVPYLRYVYPALPLASLAIAWVAAEAPAAASVSALLALIVLNLCFLPASGFYNQDFALFRHSDVRGYVERMAPTRLLIEDLNHRAPGEPVAFFSSDRTGGLNGAAYNDSWHSGPYWNSLKQATDPRAIAAMLDHLGIHYVVAPDWRTEQAGTVQLFLKVWLVPARVPIGPLGLFRIRDVNAVLDTGPIAPGTYDDLDDRIQYTGSWRHDLQFPQTRAQSLTYSDAAGAAFGFTFRGSALTYVYTQAANRGIAEITIDGRPARIDQYAAQTKWQAQQRFGGLKPGTHAVEVRVSGEKDPRSAGVFVDLDGFVIEP